MESQVPVFISPRNRVPSGIRFVKLIYILLHEELEFLRLTVSRPVRLGIGPPFGTLDQILSCSSFFVWQLLYSSFEGAFSDEKTGL
jgi:hypothetical protein